RMSPSLAIDIDFMIASASSIIDNTPTYLFSISFIPLFIKLVIYSSSLPLLSKVYFIIIVSEFSPAILHNSIKYSSSL
ncbi:hypothetical protein, partial [Clostridium perfringens]